MAQRILGIEFSPESIKVVEVAYGRRLKISNFAVIDGAGIEPERRADQFNHTLRVRGFEARDAVVALSGVQVEHRLLTLPPLSTRELRFVMQREARKSAPAGVSDAYWDYELLQAKEELGIRKNQILFVTAAASLISEAQEFFERTRVKVQRITTIGESIFNLVQKASFWNKEAVQNIVHFTASSVHVLFVHQGTLLLCRDAPIRYGEVGEAQRAERLLTEIKRSMLRLRQNFPRLKVDEVLFSGEGPLVEGLLSRATEELGVATHVLRLDDALDPSSFRGDWEEFRRYTPALAAAFGAAWRKSADRGLNLIPGNAGAKEGPPLHRRLAASVAAAALVFFFISSMGYWNESRRIAASREEALSALTMLEPILAEAAAADAERALAAARSAFMDRMAVGIEWAEIFRSLSRIVPDSAVFERVWVEGGRSPALVLTGHLRGAPGRPNADFARFFDQLRALDHFVSVEMSRPLTISHENVPGAGNGPDASPVIVSRVAFEVRCVLKGST